MVQYKTVVELFQKLHLQANSSQLNFYASQFMKLQIIPLPFVLFLSGKCGKEGKKVQKYEYLENEKSFFDEIKKKHFS